jgi:V8-like Glu-specific endopeptidase
MRQHVLTAGHCLYDTSTGGLADDKISFYPSISGVVKPFAAINALKVRYCAC